MPIGKEWRKSTRSNPSGNCVECAVEDVDFNKSSYSAPGGNCVETAAKRHIVKVRDSKDTTIQHLSVSPGAWEGFLTLVK